MVERRPGHDEQPCPPPPSHREILLAPRLAKSVVTTVLCGYGLVEIVRLIGYDQEGVRIPAGMLLIVVLLTMQVLHFSRASSRRHPRRRLPMLAAQAALIYLPLPWLGEGGLGMPAFLAANALLVLTPWAAWGTFCVVAVSSVLLETFFATDPLSLTYVGSSTIITALVVYGLTGMSELVTEVYRSREALARLAVEQERGRFARDLHDLLGYSLSAITLKTELARRLGGDGSQRANAELDDVLKISRQALNDVRVVSSGYRRMSLAAELRSATSILAAAGIDARITADPRVVEGLPEATGTVLATVLREGVTNMLRHSEPRRCSVRLDREGGRARLSVRNDGVRAASGADAPLREGTGLRNLATRVEALGGRLAAGVAPDGWFRLEAEVRDGRPDDAADPGGAGDPPPARRRPWARAAARVRSAA